MNYFLVLKINKETIPDILEVKSIDWEIGDNENFSTIIYASYHDEVNYNKTILVDKPGKYYARARFRYEEFISNWSTIKIVNLVN